MINHILRSVIYFVAFVLIQVLILNNIHFMRIATPSYICTLSLNYLLENPVQGNYSWLS